MPTTDALSALLELGTVVPCKIQKAHVDDDGVTLELFFGVKRFLHVGQSAAGPRTSVADASARQPLEGPPKAVQGLLRKELLPAALSSVTGHDTHAVVRCKRSDGKERLLLVEAPAGFVERVVVAAVTDSGDKILAVLWELERCSDGRLLKRGGVYVAPAARQATAPAPLGRIVAPAAASVDHDVVVRARTEIKRLKRLRTALDKDLAKHGDPEACARDGELLKTMLYAVKRGMRSIELYDYDGTTRTLPLDEKRDGPGNLTLFFARAKKGRAARAHAAPRQAVVHALLAEFEAALATGDVAALAALCDRAAQGHTEQSHRRKVALSHRGPRQAWRSFVVGEAGASSDAGGTVVRVGRGARDNDLLVKSARGLDVWLHARDTVGGHVIVPSRGEDVAPEVLRDAALLAVHFSSARGELHVDVQVARVKHLRKPGPHAPPGFFLVAHETVMHHRADPERLNTLLKHEVGSREPKQ